MSPPIYTPDGSEVSEIVLPDGSTASEVIGPDGDVVFEAGGDIPDTSMFQSPIYQFWAGEADESDGTSAFGFPEELAGLSDATPVGGPLLQKNQADAGGNAFDAGEYDGLDDGHDWSSDTSLPTGGETFSVAALIWTRDATNRQNIMAWGDRGSFGNNINLSIDDDQIRVGVYGKGVVNAGSIASGSWVTAGMKFDGGSIYAVANGAVSAGSSVNTSLTDQDRGIGYRAADNNFYFDGYISEVIVSNTDESDQAFSDYHTDRLG